MEQTENFLPEKLRSTITIPDDWHPEKSVKKINKLTSICKPAIEDIIVEFWIAHEKLVKKEIEGWTWGRFCKETGYSDRTPINWFEKYNMPITKTGLRQPKNFGKDNPVKTQTKPETKFQISKIAEEIKEGNVSDDHAKELGDALADAISDGTCGIRVATRAATAVKKQTKSKTQITPKKIDNFDRLRKHSNSHIEGLTFWADGTMKPETELEAGCARSILAGAANCIIQYARLGIDIEGICQTLIEGKGKNINDDKQKNKYLKLKQIN